MIVCESLGRLLAVGSLSGDRLGFEKGLLLHDLDIPPGPLAFGVFSLPRGLPGRGITPAHAPSRPAAAPSAAVAATVAAAVGTLLWVLGV